MGRYMPYGSPIGGAVGEERDLRLNSIDRYIKSSPNLVLEEHGHCEVPAGCGGVVLRWRNPSGPLPVKLAIWLNVDKFSVTIDGTPPSTSRPLLSPGPHVVVIEVHPETEVAVQLLFTATAELEDGNKQSVTPPPRDWLWSDVEPLQADASKVEFDATGWSSMVDSDLTPRQRKDYQISRLIEDGAIAMKTLPRSGPVWMRAVVHIPAPR